MPYTIEEHKHRFAAWAASRAASVKGCRFSVEQGKAILERVQLNRLLPSPENLPAPKSFDEVHREWRNQVVSAAQELGLEFTHGVAAKLINTYLKAAFVCGGYHNHIRVKAIHPPIDSLLLNELSRQNVGGFRRAWNEARQIRWSKLNSDEYERVIHSIRAALKPDAALWEAEQYWQGYQ
jgi:hypothetical protein